MTNPVHSSTTILAIFEEFADEHPEENFTIRDLVDHMGDHGLLILLLIFALFCAIPLPIPGIHVVLSLPLFYVTVQQAMGRHSLWLPEAILSRSLPRAGFVAMTDYARPWMLWIDRHVEPRLVHFTDGQWYKIMGGVCLFITCIIVIPLPLTNVVPALSIAGTTLGMMCRDGRLTLISAAIGMIWCLMWLALAAAIGAAGISAIYSVLFS